MFSMQQIPVLLLLEFFAGSVLSNPILEQAHALHRSRLLFNLGLKAEGTKLQDRIEAKRYLLSDEEKKVQYEKIKAMNDSKSKDGDKVHFAVEKDSEPQVVEAIKIHEAWVGLAEELLKWGEFARAKNLATEAALHAGIFKDADSYTKAMLVLSSVAFVEGASASSLKLCMASHQAVRDLQLLE